MAADRLERPVNEVQCYVEKARRRSPAWEALWRRLLVEVGERLGDSCGEEGH